MASLHSAVSKGKGNHYRRNKTDIVVRAENGPPDHTDDDIDDNKKEHCKYANLSDLVTELTH